MSLYEPPFLYPSEPQVLSSGLHIGRFYGHYGNPNKASAEDQVEGGMDATLEAIETYAPTVATLIAGLSPEESVGVLQSRIQNLQKYKSIPLVGDLAKSKIAEYRARIPVLKKQAEQDKIQRVATTAGYIVGLLALGGLAFMLFSSGYRQIKEAE